MRWLFKWLFRLVLVLAALVILLVVFKDSLLRVVAEQRIRATTGMDARIGKVHCGLISPVVSIENLRIRNTAEFGGTPFLDVPELHLEFDPVALARRQLHITLMRFNLAEFNVVKNELGQTNLVSLLNKLQTQASKQGDAGKQLKDFQFTGIDVLNLTMGKARLVDLKEARNNREVQVNLQNQIFKNVKTGRDLAGILFLIWLRSGGNLSMMPAKFSP